MPNSFTSSCNVVNSHTNADVWRKDPTTVADEVATKPATNLHNSHLHRKWQSNDAVVTNTTLQKDLGDTHNIRAISIHNTNLSSKSQVRAVTDDHWARRWYVDADGRTTGITIPDVTLQDDYTFEFWFRTQPGLDDSSVSFIGYLGTADSDGSRDWIILILQGPGTLRVALERGVVGDVNLDSTSRVDDCLWHHAAFTFNETSNEANLYLDFVLEDTVSDTRATPSITTADLVLNSSSLQFDIGPSVRLWNTDQTLPIITANRSILMRGSEQDLELCWELQDDSPTITDVTGNHNGTWSGAVTLKLWNNPHATYSRLLQFGGPWRSRRYVRYDGVNDASRTATVLSASYHVSVALWLRIPSTLTTGANSVVLSFGTSSGNTVYDFLLYIHSVGGLRFSVARYGGSVAELNWGSSLLKDDAWHRVVIAIDGRLDKMYMYVDGSAHASNGQVCNGYAAKSGTERFAIGSHPHLGSKARVDIAGDIVVMSRTITPADDKPYTRFAPEDDTSILGHYTIEEGTGDEEIQHSNRGSWGSAGHLTTAESAGTPDHTNFVNAVRGDLPTVLDVDVPLYLSRQSTRNDLVLQLPSTVACGYLAVVIYDPDNTDGYVTIGVIDVWEEFNPGLKIDGEFSGEIVTPDLHSTPSNVSVRSIGVSSKSVLVVYNALTKAECADIVDIMQSARELSTIMLVISSSTEDDAQHWSRDAVYGIPKSIEWSASWEDGDVYEVEVLIESEG